MMLSRFLDKLKASEQADGTTLVDNTTIAFGSNLSTKHFLNNCPTVIAGGGAGFKHGCHLVMKDPQTPLCNL